jgi:hypothetical protein
LNEAIMLTLVAALALVAGHTDKPTRVPLSDAEALIVNRKVIARQIGGIQHGIVPVALVGGDPTLIQEYRNKRIKMLLDPLRGEDRHDPINRFFRVGITL